MLSVNKCPDCGRYIENVTRDIVQYSREYGTQSINIEMHVGWPIGSQQPHPELNYGETEYHDSEYDDRENLSGFKCEHCDHEIASDDDELIEFFTKHPEPESDMVEIE